LLDIVKFLDVLTRRHYVSVLPKHHPTNV